MDIDQGNQRTENHIVMSNSEKKMLESWIRDCLFEYVALHLDGMEDYFHQCWSEARRAVSGVPGYKKWLEGCQAQSTIGDMVGEYWYQQFKGKEKEFKKFMEDIDFSGYVDKFKEEFEVNIVWIQPAYYFQKHRLDIVIRML